jgi:hypothetical protein
MRPLTLALGTLAACAASAAPAQERSAAQQRRQRTYGTSDGLWITNWEIDDRLADSMPEATWARDRFFSRVEHSGGVFVIKRPEAWQPALDAIAARLARQWMVVYEPESDRVRSEEVEVFERRGGRRRRLR